MKIVSRVFRISFSIFYSLIIANSACAAELNDQAYEVLNSSFQYDKSFPLEFNITKHSKFGEHSIESFTFESFHDGAVFGLLALPSTGKAPFPTIILLHGITSNKESWLGDSFTHGGEITKGLLDKGYAIVALDAQYHGERLPNNNNINAADMVFEKKWYARYSNLIKETVVDYRRLLDYLETNDNFDINRIGILGYSMGAQMAFILAANDLRVKSLVGCVVPGAAGLLIEPATFAPKLAHLPLIMMMAEKDNFYTKEEAQVLFNSVASDDKSLQFYDSGHSLPKQYTLDAINWIEKNL